MVINTRIEQVVNETRNLAAAAVALNEIKSLKNDIANPSELKPGELLAFERSFRKSVRTAAQTFDHSLTGIFARHKLDIMLGLLVAKRQIEGVFGGTDESGSGIAAIFNPEPVFFGKDGDDWRGQTPATAGSAQNFIHSGTTALGGSAGEDVQIMAGAVHVIVGWANYSQDYPRVTKIQERFNTSPQAVLNVGSVWKNEHADYPVKYFELDTPRILSNDSKYRVQTFAEAVIPSSEWIWPVGVMFLKQSQTLEFDIAGKSSLANYLKDHELIVKTA